MKNIPERIKKTIVEQLGIDAKKVTDGASFTRDLGADSLDTIELVMAFEQEFGVVIPDDVADRIQTVSDAVKAVAKASA